MTKKRMLAFLLTAGLLLSALPLSAAQAAQTDAGGKPAAETLQQEIRQYNYVIGTNAFAPGYQFTEQERCSSLRTPSSRGAPT